MRVDLNQLDFVETRLKAIAVSIEKHFGVEFTITSMLRINDSGVHSTLPLRGIDLRCPDAALGSAVEQYVNDSWVYDPNRPSLMCCIHHDAGSGLHLHLQTHPKTIFKLKSAL